MSHLKSPPDIANINAINNIKITFPASIEQILETIRPHNVDQEVVSLLKEFSPSTSFSSRSDLMANLRSLAMLMSEEVEAPFEKLISPQE